MQSNPPLEKSFIESLKKAINRENLQSLNNISNSTIFNKEKIDLLDVYGINCLQYAVLLNNYNIVRLLIKSGSNKNIMPIKSIIYKPEGHFGYIIINTDETLFDILLKSFEIENRAKEINIDSISNIIDLIIDTKDIYKAADCLYIICTQKSVLIHSLSEEKYYKMFDHLFKKLNCFNAKLIGLIIYNNIKIEYIDQILNQYNNFIYLIDRNLVLMLAVLYQSLIKYLKNTNIETLKKIINIFNDNDLKNNINIKNFLNGILGIVNLKIKSKNINSNKKNLLSEIRDLLYIKLGKTFYNKSSNYSYRDNSTYARTLPEYILYVYRGCNEYIPGIIRQSKTINTLDYSKDLLDYSISYELGSIKSDISTLKC